MMMRLFIGIFVDKTLFEGVFGRIKEEFREAVRAKWVEKDNLHFTVQFLGEADDAALGAILDSAGDDFREYNSPLEISGLSAFPNTRGPRVLYADVFNPEGSLFAAQAAIQGKMKKLGFKPEGRKYVPHITLARIKECCPEEFARAFKVEKDRYFGKMENFRICLVKSDLTRTGPIYTVIK